MLGVSGVGGKCEVSMVLKRRGAYNVEGCVPSVEGDCIGASTVWLDTCLTVEIAEESKLADAGIRMRFGVGVATEKEGEVVD